MMRWHYLDGEADAPGPDDRGFAYGDGLFETIAVRDGRPRLLERHLERLRLGADRLALRLPARERIEDFVARVVGGMPAGDDGRAVLKLVATRGDGERGYAYRHSDARLLAGIGHARSWPQERRQRGVALRWCRTRLGRNPALAGLKHLDRLEQVLARAEWDDQDGIVDIDDIAEGLMLDSDGRVVCATMSNLFLVRGGRLVTPAVTHAGVAGIMRGLVLELADRLGLDTTVREVEPAEVMAAEELFLTNSQYVLWPVARLGRREWTRGPLTARLTAALEAAGLKE